MRLDIIIPAHNEQHRIDETLLRYRAAFTEPGTHFLVALDDCTDGTLDIVRSHHDVDSRVRAMSYPRLGKGGVLAETFRQAHGDLVAFVDADGATPPEELHRLIDTCIATDSDISIASRFHPAAILPVARRRSRKVTSTVFACAVRKVFGMQFHDTQCGAKVVRRAAAARIIPLLSSRDFIFDVDLLLIARALDFSVAEVPTVWLDQDGSRLSTRRDATRMAASLLLLWLRHRIVPIVMPAAAVVDIDSMHPASKAAALTDSSRAA